jgi:alkylation response protein AidB-like acyl-CoA dehydrogenase
MAIDFTLTAEQKALKKLAREFSQEILKPLVKAADAEPDPQRGFQMIRPAYEQAYKLGFATGFLPKEYGGGGLTNVDVQIAVEEIGAVDPGFGCVLLVNGLALMPLVWFGTPEQKKKWLTEACNDASNSYLAGWVVSERAGQPGGTANFDTPEPKAGMRMTAEKVGDEYILNGRKFWPSSAAGWDMKGANVNTVIARTDEEEGGRKGLSAFMVPRGTEGVRFEPVIDKMGQRVNQNCDIVFANARIPTENAFAIGNGDLIISKAFTWSGPVAGIAAVGTARSAYEYVLDWSKTYTAGGTDPIIYYQNTGYMLTDIAMRIEACRYLCWKAAHYLDQHDSEGHAIGAMAKIYAGEVCTQVVYDCMRVMGVNSYDRATHPIDKYMRDVLCFPIYDAGNMGMQRRKIWGVMASKDFDPNAFSNTAPVPFSKNTEGLGSVAYVPEPEE